jgi:diacylglycerol kinase family enzyme
VVAAGGDGTVAKVADVLTGSDAVLGVLPTGTGNVLARELGIPGDLEAAAGVLAGGRPRLIDAMEVDGGRRRCFSHVSLGTYARIASMDSPDQKRRLGRLAYLRNLYTEVGAGRSWPFHLSVDGSDRQVTASMILVANVAATGLPGLTWSGRAEPDDGVLDVCIVRATTIPGYLRLAAQAMLGRHDEAAGIEYLACRHRLAIEAPADLAVRGDGKELGNGRLDLSVVPRSVAVLVAAGIAAA